MKKNFSIFCFLGLVSAPLMAQYEPSFVLPPFFATGFGLYEPFTPSTSEEDDSEASAPTDLSFTPSRALRKKNLATFVSLASKENPDYAPILRDKFGDGAVFGQYGELLRSVGLNANDAGDNMAVWMITMWEAAQGRPVEIAPEHYAVVKRQLNGMLSNSKFTGLSDAEKQTMADDFMMQSLVTTSNIDHAKTDPAFAKQLAAGIKRDMKTAGLDFDTMTLIGKGFRYKSR